MSCAPGLEALYNSGVPDDAPKYHCCYCGGTFTATEADLGAAQARAADVEGAAGMALSDTAAFEAYGRDVCDRPECVTLAARTRRDAKPLPSDTALLDYLDEHPTAFFFFPDGPTGDVVLCERDERGGENGLGSGRTPRHAIADAIASVESYRRRQGKEVRSRRIRGASRAEGGLASPALSAEPLPTRDAINALVVRVRSAAFDEGNYEDRPRRDRAHCERLGAEKDLAALLDKWERALPKAAA